MKRIFIFTVLIGGVSATAFAATKCVKLDANVEAADFVAAEYEPDWTVTEADGTVLRGIGVCGNKKRTDDGQACMDDISLCLSDTITVSGSGGGVELASVVEDSSGSDGSSEWTYTEENSVCWCRLVSPAVSSWVFLLDRGSASYCARYCGTYCAGRARVDPVFRGALFSGLGA